MTVLFRAKSCARLLLLIFVAIAIGCSADNDAPPASTNTPGSTQTETETAEVADATSTLPPVVISEPATPTPISTDIPPTETPTPEPTATLPPEPTATEVVEEIATAEPGGCRPLEQTINYTNQYLITDALPPHIASPIEINTGFSNVPKLIHLGFDVEGSAEVMGPLLDVLDRRQVKATMFILGSWGHVYPEWVTEMGARGHEFANHSWSHRNMAEMDAETVKKELAQTEQLVRNLTGKSTLPFVRPPFGSRSEISVQAAYEVGYSTVIWTGSTEDWREGANAESMCRTLLETSFPGGILYSHTWHPEMPETIDRYIGELQAQGYTFVPLSVILSGQQQDYLVPNN